MNNSISIELDKMMRPIIEPARCFFPSELAPVPDMTPMVWVWAVGGLVVASLILLAASVLLVLRGRNEKTRNPAPPPAISKRARRRRRLFHDAATGPRSREP